MSGSACHNCGAQLMEGASFCSNCGSRVEATAPEASGSPIGSSTIANRPGLQAPQTQSAPSADVGRVGAVVALLALIGFWWYASSNGYIIHGGVLGAMVLGAGWALRRIFPS